MPAVVSSGALLPKPLAVESRLLILISLGLNKSLSTQWQTAASIAKNTVHTCRCEREEDVCALLCQLYVLNSCLPWYHCWRAWYAAMSDSPELKQSTKFWYFDKRNECSWVPWVNIFNVNRQTGLNFPAESLAVKSQIKTNIALNKFIISRQIFIIFRPLDVAQNHHKPIFE